MLYENEMCAVRAGEEEVVMVDAAAQTDEWLAADLPAGIVVDVETDIRLRQTLDTMQMHAAIGNRLSAYEDGIAAAGGGDTSALLYSSEQERTVNSAFVSASPNNLNEFNLISPPEPVAELPPDR